MLDDTLTHRSGSETPRLPEEESLLSINDQDLIEDDVWERQQQILQSNREWREKLKLQLARKKELNEALLKEEQERRALAKIELEVSRLETRRLVKPRQKIVNFDNMADCDYMGDDTEVGHNGGRGQHVQMHAHEHDNGTEYELVHYETRGGRIPQVPVNPMTGQEKINKWLANSEGLNAYHKTRSEPGHSAYRQVNYHNSHSHLLNPRRAMQDER